MSNAAQFFPIGKRLGEVITLPYNGDIFTATDGTIWKITNAKPVSYSATYSQLLTDSPLLVTAATQLNGPNQGNRWMNFVPDSISGSTAGGATWLMTGRAVASHLDFYYTSTNAGSTWTQRTPPVAGKSWMSFWDGTNFIIYAFTTGVTGVQESTDGITWTARTAISFTPRAILYSGTVYLAVAGSGTVCATSPDRTTWTSRTCTAQASQGAFGPLGQATWNVGAALFIMATSTAGQYQTSPDGITWTNRTTINAIPGLAFATSGMGFASDATTTSIIVSQYGTVAVSTDGINWTAYDIDSSFFPGTTAPSFVFWDGTRFVIGYFSGAVIYYSTNGTSWTKATRGTLPNTGVLIKIPGGIGTHPGSSVDIGYKLSDVTSTTSNSIVYPTPATTDASTRTYMRIL